MRLRREEMMVQSSANIGEQPSSWRHPPRYHLTYASIPLASLPEICSEAAYDSHPILRDALVTYAVMAPCRNEDERTDVVGNLYSPLDMITRIPSPEEAELPTVRLLLKRTPDVLHQRVKLLLGDHVRKDFSYV